jgi:hypothetical protein
MALRRGREGFSELALEPDGYQFAALLRRELAHPFDSGQPALQIPDF